MMSEKGKVLGWSPPKWHKDFGSPQIELDKLKLICFELLDAGFEFDFELDCFEEGYMVVNFYLVNDLVGSIQVVDGGRIGVFFENDDEFYIDLLEGGTREVIYSVFQRVKGST